MRRIAIAVTGLVLGGAFYLLLIDTRSLPELYALAGVALLSAIAFAISRQQDLGEAVFRVRWLRFAWRPIARVPEDIVTLSGAAIMQLLQRKRARGEFRAVPFKGGMSGTDHGRRALTELLGSVAPNTIVIGVDPDRELLLVHQLRREGNADDIDVLRLG
jgi:hypothetical protein